MTYTLVPNRNLTVVTSDFKVITIAADNPNWKAILECIRKDDEAGVVRLMSIKETVKSFGIGVQNRGDIEIRGSDVYYRTEKLYGEDVSRILSFVQDGIQPTGMINFLERKLKNPSKRSVDSLYHFLENRGMPITPRGTFLGYKGLLGDYASRNTGVEPLVSGIRLTNGAIDNHIGQSPRVERRYVCDDFNQGCGPGLHVGSLEYAIDFAEGEGRVVIVEVDPADVVSVPNEEHTKLRTCAYTVVGEYTEKLPDVYTDEFVRPDGETVVEDEPICRKCGFTEDDCDCENGFEAEHMPLPPASDFHIGYQTGQTVGRNHQKRKFYEDDKGRTFTKFSTTYVDGYLKGYKDGRRG
jgi:hypothetical protein